MSVQFNVRDLPEYGIHIISPLDPSFKGMFSSHFQDRSNATIEALAPFSIFIKNTNPQHVVAYTLKWEMMRPDGRVLTHLTSYAEPGVLMGNDLVEGSSSNGRYVIRPNATQFISWVPNPGNPGEDLNQSIKSFGGGSSNAADAGSIQAALQQRDGNRILNKLNSQLSQAVNLTVTIDGLFFEDGSFVGPNGTGYFEQIQSQVKAKMDLYDEIASAKKEHKNLESVFASIESKSGLPDVQISSESTPEDFYRFYTKLFSKEIVGIKKAYGTDKAEKHIAALRARRRPQLKKRRNF